MHNLIKPIISPFILKENLKKKKKFDHSNPLLFWLGLGVKFTLDPKLTNAK